jgi:hypothetical protein
MNESKRLFDDPAAIFTHPLQVLNVPQLTFDEKLFVLRRWKGGLERKSGKSTPTGGVQHDLRARLAAVVDAIKRLHRSGS